MNVIIPVASGKGGVGKTVVAANLGVSLAKKGKTVILVDLDLGGSNLHTCLGIRNKYAGLGSYIYKKEESFESLIVETEVPRLFFIPGDSLLPGTSNLSFFVKKKIMKELTNLVADFVILDLGSGTAYNTVDFFLISSSGILVTTPETTSILNAYSFLKTTLFRMLYRAFPAKSKERGTIFDFSTSKIEGSDTGFLSLVEEIGRLNQESGIRAKQVLSSFLPRVVLNMGKSNQDLPLGAKLRQIVRKNLDIELEYIGFIRHDEQVPLSIFKRKPLAFLEPESTFAKTVDQIAQKIIVKPVPEGPVLFEDNEDLFALGNGSNGTE